MPGGAPRLQGELLRMESPVVHADEGEIGKRFGRGRPPGAKNIASRVRAQLFEQIAGDQLLAQARILAMPLDMLAKMLGCKAYDAAVFQQKVRVDALPYLYSKQPLAVAVSGKVANFHITVPNAGGGSAVGPQAILDLLTQQALIEAGEGFNAHEGGEIARIEAIPESEDETTT